MAVTSEIALGRNVVVRPRHRRLDVAGIVLWGFAALVFLFLLMPLLILLLTSFTATQTVEFPPQGLSLRWYITLVDTLRGQPGARPGLVNSLWVSTWLGVLVAAIAVVSGVLAAVALHKFKFWSKDLFSNLFLLPLTFPQLVIGIGLLLFFSELPPVYRSMFGTKISVDPFTRLLIGHVVIAVPYVILTVGASLKVYEEDVEEAARSLGANGIQTFWNITLPLIRPGIIAGAVFAFITSFTQFTISFFLFSGQNIPLPIWLYDFISHGHNPLLAAISVFLITLTFVVVFALERLIGVRRIFSSGA